MNQFNRRQFVKTAGAFAATSAITNLLPEASVSAQKDLLLYVGTYTSGKSKSQGIYIYRMNPTTGELKPHGVAGGIADPSFLAFAPKRRFLYAVNETGNFLGKKSGGLTAMAVDQKTGLLSKLNEISLPGVPCHVSVHPSGKAVLAANYGGGNVVICPVKSDGSLGEVGSMVQHSGKGGDPKRQDAPHAHMIKLDASGNFAFAPDLGIDKVMIYKVDAAKAKLQPAGSVAVKPAAGPRHFDFHPTEKYGYVINELDSTVTAFSYDKAKGSLKELQTVSTLPADFKETNYCADLHVHPSGKFLYGSNRGHNSIAIFSIDGGTGKLTLIGHESTQGKWPRNFGIDPSGQFLLVANQQSDSVVTFRIDQQTGKLTATGQITEIPAPVCLKFIPAFS
ncbi:MAG: lactonase family protein [Blastocatellales bacterium]